MEKFSFFNDVNDDRVYYAEDWARHLKKYFTNGIFNNELNVVSNNDMTITIKEGDANIEGYRYTNTGDLVKTIDNADGTLNRIDNVVLRLDLTNRLISAQIIKGTFADKPVAPELVRTSTIYDLRIAKISIPAGTTTITQDLITDTRFITSDCGNVISTVQTPDTENLFIQMQTLFEKQINELNNNFEIWFDSIKNQLDSDAAGNLQNQINNLNSNKVDNATYDPNSKNLQLLANGKNVGDSVHIPTGITDTATDEEDLKIVNNKGVVKFSVEGKTEQDSYTGKNILDYVSNLKASSDGLTNVINDDGSITTSGKPTGNYRTIINEINITDILEDGQTYTISQNIASDKLYAQVGATKKTGEISYFSCALGKGKYSFKVDKTIYENYSLKIQTGIISTWGDESLTITNKYMLCKGTDTADSSFEPYVGGTQSPNPDYPQKIEDISGVKNLLNIQDGTYTSNGITAVVKDGVITLNGTATARSMITISLSTFKSGSYTIAVNNEQTIGAADDSSDFAACRIAYTNGSVLRDCYLGKKNSSGNFIISNDININFNIRTAANLTYNNFVIKPQLEESLIVHDYVPYGSNYLQLKNQSKNFLIYPYIYKSNYTDKGITYVTNNDGSVTINGTATSNSWFFLSNDTQDWYLDGSETYEFTILDKNEASVNGIVPQYFSSKNGQHRGQNGKLTLNYSEDNTTNWNLVIFVFKGTTVSNVTVYPMIRKANIQDTKYEPYKKKIINIDLKGNNLCSNKEQTLKDELMIENGRAKIIKKYDEVVLDGTEDWVYDSTYKYFRCPTFDFGIQIPVFNANQLSNYFNITTSWVTFRDNINQNLMFSIQNTSYKICIRDVSCITAEQFKSKLKSQYDSGTPVKVQYQLAEPEVVDLGKVDFELLEGNSTLNLEEDLKSNMSIKYYTDSTVVDLKKKVENKQNVILHGTTIPSNDLGEDGDIYLQHN